MSRIYTIEPNWITDCTFEIFWDSILCDDSYASMLLWDMHVEDESVEIHCSDYCYLADYCETIPGWNNGPEDGDHPVLFEIRKE